MSTKVSFPVDYDEPWTGGPASAADSVMSDVQRYGEIPGGPPPHPGV